MKVLFITKFFYPELGGIERYSQILCAGLRDKGVYVEIVAAAKNSRYSEVEVIDGIRVHRLGVLSSLSGAPIMPSAFKLLAELSPQFDLVHHNFPNPWVELCQLVVGNDSKSLVTYHSDIIRQKILMKLYRFGAHQFLKRVSAIVATSPNYIASSSMLSRHIDRCHCIPLPIITTAVPTANEKAEEQKNYGKFVLFVGRLVYYKGLDFLIQAIGLLSDVQLVVVGDGPLENEHRSLAMKLNLKKRIHFLGQVSDKRLGALYAASRCLVLPSLFRSEAFGMVLGEAMAHGTPVISTELGTGTSYINDNEKTGFVVPPGNSKALAEKIELIYKNDDLHYELGKKAKQRALKEFSKEAMIKKTLSLYSQLCP